MSQYRRARVPGACYFFTLVTYRRRSLFSQPEIVQLLREAIRTAKQRRPFQIEAMVVLPDHLHCIWRLPEKETDFSSRWRDIKQSLSKQIDASVNHRGEKAVWQRRFWEHLIRDEQDWRNHLDYIHYNPVHHGLAESPMDWPHSSFRRCVERGWYEADWGANVSETVLAMDCE